MPALSARLLCLGALLASAGCARDELDISTGTVGQRITRSACPAVAIPAHTGDLTFFNPPATRTAQAIDVVATLTELRGTCGDETGEQLTTSATFRVDARRANGAGAREVVIPYFATVVRGGTQIVSKEVSRVALRFAEGELRASATGTAQASISRAATTLPEAVRQQITRRRRPGDADAAVDPMADPAVRAAVAQSSFELLVGFQLTPDQLAYNATR